MPYVTESDYAELLRSDYQNSELRARIEALTAERDAAVAKLAGTEGALDRTSALLLPSMESNFDAGITEGERRATAAIVAFAERDPWFAADGHVSQLLVAIERGDHLNPLDT